MGMERAYAKDIFAEERDKEKEKDRMRAYGEGMADLLGARKAQEDKGGKAE